MAASHGPVIGAFERCDALSETTAPCYLSLSWQLAETTSVSKARPNGHYLICLHLLLEADYRHPVPEILYRCLFAVQSS